ncbi:hypothetical protein JOB18_002014 [Solea senegalensis]|uniref:Uncharacterized protein n=1 Tax=Solea senegalensis TaxID=28829 RepID=A0AAV6SG98_SOLSE|nr:hypothetical protein JOB18_002014 [Solea senegalensis]
MLDGLFRHSEPFGTMKAEHSPLMFLLISLLYVSQVQHSHTMDMSSDKQGANNELITQTPASGQDNSLGYKGEER